MANSVRQLKEEAEDNLNRKMRLFNPTTGELEYQYEGKTYVIESMQMVELPYNQGRHAKKKLVDFVMNYREINPLADKTEIENEVEVSI